MLSNSNGHRLASPETSNDEPLVMCVACGAWACKEPIKLRSPCGKERSQAGLLAFGSAMAGKHPTALGVLLLLGWLFSTPKTSMNPLPTLFRRPSALPRMRLRLVVRFRLVPLLSVDVPLCCQGPMVLWVLAVRPVLAPVMSPATLRWRPCCRES